jgi:DASH complex subunit SPC19
MAHALEGCVSSLRESLVLLDSSIQRIDSGVNDFPRLSKVLRSTRVRMDCKPSRHSVY